MKTDKNIFIAFLLNFMFSIFEFVGGLFTGSVAILSDALHDFGDAISIGLSFFLEKFSKRQPNNKYTYGYARFSVLGGVCTITILIIGSIFIIGNAINKFINPVQINFNGMLVFAIVGLIINAIATFFTHGGHSINQKAVNLHMVEDLLGWVIVLFGAIIIKLTNFYYLDPILSICIAIFILIQAIGPLKQILNIFLIKTPNNINLEDIKTQILSIDASIKIHSLKIWTIDGEEHFLNLHIILEKQSDKIKQLIKQTIYKNGIYNVLIETSKEPEEIIIPNKKPKPNSHCHHHH